MATGHPDRLTGGGIKPTANNHSPGASTGFGDGDKLRLVRTLESVSAQVADTQAEKLALVEELRALRAELAETRARQDFYRGRSEALGEAVQSLEERLHSHSNRAIRLSSRLHEKKAMVRTLRYELRRTREDLDQSKQSNSAAESLDARLVATLSELQRSREEFRAASTPEELRRNSETAVVPPGVLPSPERQILGGDDRAGVLAAISQFDVAQADFLNVIRSQRAWRIMLMIRKAYTLWTKRNWKAGLDILRTPLQSSSAADNALAPYDVVFPSIWDYLPASLLRPPREDGEIGKPPRPVTRYDVLILPVFDFEFRFQRPQQIASEFARSGHRVYWLSPTRFEQQDGRPASSVPLRENIFELRLPAPSRNIYTDTLTPAEAERLSKHILDFLSGRELAETVVLTQFPYWRQVALRLRECAGFPVVYDCMDDWRNWTAEPRISAFALEEEQRIAREADVVLATSAELQQRMQASSGREVLRVRNGADFESFRDAAPRAMLSNIPRPIIGYYGAISDWVDTDLMASVARERPAYSFVIIGEVHNVDVSSLRKLPNVHMLGEKNYRFIPSYLAEFDVAILPFKINKLTHAVDPVKVYEYLSQGKPVVATRLPEVCDHGDMVYLAGESDFASAIDRAVAEPKTQTARRASYAAENSWTARVSVLKRAIASTYPLVSIIIVSYNSRVYLELLLDSIRTKTAYPNYEVIVVDNNSDDGTTEFLNTWIGRIDRLRIFPLAANTGFAAGNNYGAREARGEYLVFLNADTIVTRGWLQRLIRPLREDSIGVSAPVTNFSGNETRIETAYRDSAELDAFAASLGRAKKGETLDIPMAPFLCVAMKRAMWEKVGELDERFGIGMFEDDDYAVRVRSLGYRIVAVEDAFIHHFGNGSFSKLPPEESLALFGKNREYFERKSGRQWKSHQMRPGVAPPGVERHSPAAFSQTAERSPERGAELRLGKLHPETVMVGQAVNRQPNGASAIVVECSGATPGTVIKFGAELLHTAYGSGSLLSAELPPDFNHRPSTIPVTLVNDFGASNTMIFKVEG